MQTKLIVIVSLSSVHLPESSLHHCTTSLTRLDSTKRENTLIFALLNGPMLLFVYFLPFLIIISIIQIEKSLDGGFGIQTRGRKMVGADETTELGCWIHTNSYSDTCEVSIIISITNLWFNVSSQVWIFNSSDSRKVRTCHKWGK